MAFLFSDMSPNNVTASNRELEDFLDRMRPRLKSLFARYRIPVQDTEDIVQHALLQLIYQWANIRDPESWLIGTLRKTCLLYWRKRRRALYEAVDSAMLEWIGGVDPPVQEQSDLRRDIEVVLAKLPSRCRLLLRLRYGFGLDPAELAAQTGYSRSSISKVSLRCLAALGRHLGFQNVAARRREEARPDRVVQGDGGTS